MEQELTIQQVAALTGLSEHTLRYYERERLLEPISRSSSGHRRYRTVAERTELLKCHQLAVRERIDALERNLAAIASKIQYYEHLEAEAHGQGDAPDTLRTGTGAAGGNQRAGG